MANKKITDFTELTTVSENDLLLIVDVSDLTESDEGTTKKIKKSNIVTIDPTPTDGSTNAVSSDGVFDALALKANDADVLHKTGDETKNGKLIINTSTAGDALLVQNTAAGIQNAIEGIANTNTGGIGIKGVGSVGVLGEGDVVCGVRGTSTGNTGVEGVSTTGLAGRFNTISGTKIMSFLAGGIEKAYILATGLFKANKILVNTDTDNGVDALQVNGSSSFLNRVIAQQLFSARHIDGKNYDDNSVIGDLFLQFFSPTSNTYIGGDDYLGNVGIGTLIPLYKLDVRGSISVSEDIVQTGLATHHYFGSGTNKVALKGMNGVLEFYTGNAVYNKAIQVNPNGNVLVNTDVDDGVNRLQVNGTILSTQYKISSLNTAPSSATDTGTIGEIRYTADYIYVCVATNTWKRTALTTW